MPDLDIKQSILALNLDEENPAAEEQSNTLRLIEDIHTFSKANRRVRGGRKARLPKSQLLTFAQMSDQEPETR